MARDFRGFARILAIVDMMKAADVVKGKAHPAVKLPHINGVKDVINGGNRARSE